MSLLIADCPRCRAQKMTFELLNQVYVGTFGEWQKMFEIFCVCRGCSKSTIFLVSQKNYEHRSIISQGLNKIGGIVNNIVYVERYISIQDNSAEPPPQHVPENIEKIFKEGSICMATCCYNAAATMFRLCLDLATKSLLPKTTEESNHEKKPNHKTIRLLGPRLSWLFDEGKIPENLRDLSTCIKDGGNDGAHEGSLSKEDAEDILDFTVSLLEQLYTQPVKLKIAERRRKLRRADS